jgi:Ca2+-binding EF-hand superfamily protein
MPTHPHAHVRIHTHALHPQVGLGMANECEPEVVMRLGFKMFDLDGDGYIEPQHLKRLLTRNTQLTGTQQDALIKWMLSQHQGE